MLLVDSKIESYKVISIVWQSTYFKISVNFDDVSPMKIILQTLSSSFLGDLKGSSMTRWQEPGGSQRQMLEQKKTHARIHFPAPNPMLLYLNFPRVNSLCKDGLISFTFRWLRFLFKMSAGLSPHPAPPPTSFWSPRSCLLPQANLMMAGPQSQKRKNTCGQWKV